MRIVKVLPQIWSDSKVLELQQSREPDLFRAMNELEKQVHSPKEVWKRLNKEMGNENRSV